MKMKFYISGQITGIDYNEAFANFERAEKILKSLNIIPINPMKKIPFNKDWVWEDYMKADIKLLMDCNGIYMLSNWENSKGAKIEYNLAKKLNYIIIKEW